MDDRTVPMEIGKTSDAEKTEADGKSKRGGTARKGGIVWLAAAVVISLLWAEPENLWRTAAAGWIAVAAAWIGRKLLRRELSGRDAGGSWLALAGFAVVAWACGEAVAELRLRLFDLFDMSRLFGATLEPSVKSGAWVGALGLGLLIACIGGAWLLSSVAPAVSSNAGWRFDKIVVRSFGQLKRSRTAGSYAAVAGIVTVAAAMIAEQAELPWRIVMGLAAAYTQICWLAQTERRQTAPANSTSGSGARVSRTIRWAVGITLVGLHLLLFGFYFYLKGVNEWFPSQTDWFPLGWGVGAVLALIAWGSSLSRIIYMVLMFAIGLACALLLGTIAGAFDWGMLA